jgi:hypothetical protein
MSLANTLVSTDLGMQIHRADRDCTGRDGVGPMELRGGAPEQP